MENYSKKMRIVKLICGIIVFVLLSTLVIQDTPSPFPLPYGERIKVRGLERKFLYNEIRAGGAKRNLNTEYRTPHTAYCIPNTAYRITIGVDNSVLQKLGKYTISEKVSFASSNSTSEEKLRNLPRYPFSKKILSVTQETSDIFIYETRQNAKSAARYFVREMKRRGWNLCSGRGLASQPLLAGETFLFHNKDGTYKSVDKMCLFHAESNSGTTTITVVYFDYIECP